MLYCAVLSEYVNVDFTKTFAQSSFDERPIDMEFNEPVEALAVLDLGVVKAVRQQDTP